MSCKALLVHLDTSRHAEARLEVALSRAQRFGAHLIGMFATFVPDPRSLYVMAGSAGYFGEHQQRRDELRSEIERRFHAGLTRATVDGEWIAASGYADDAVTREGRYADLVIVGQADPGDPEAFGGVTRTLFESMTLPVLMSH